MNEKEQIAYYIVILIAALVFVSLRLWVVLYVRRGDAGTRLLANILSDVFVVMGFLLGVSEVSIDILCLMKTMEAKEKGIELYPGLGVPIDFVITYCKMLYYTSIGYISIMWCAKASLLCNYYVISRCLSRRLKILVGICITYNALAYPTWIFPVLFWCRPMRRYWDMGENRCIASTIPEIAILGTSIHLSTDFMIMFTGFAIIRTLRLGSRERWALGFIFLIGALTIATAIIRCTLQLQLIEAKRDRDTSSTERLIHGMLAAGTAEALSAIVAVCLPSFRVWLREKGVRSTGETQSAFMVTADGERGDRTTRGDRIYVDTYWSVERDADESLRDLRLPSPVTERSIEMDNRITNDPERGLVDKLSTGNSLK